MGLLRPVCKEPVLRKFTTYDFEWYPGALEVERDVEGLIVDARKDLSKHMRLCGAYDDKKGYRKYKSVIDFCEGEFCPQNNGRWFYAHAGGLADIQFVFEVLIKDDRYSVEATFSGSSAIIVHIRRGELKWTCIDSYWLLRDKLANIGKKVGIAKLNDYRCPNHPDCGHLPGHCIFYAPDVVLEPYNEQDCTILWVAIQQFETTLLNLGGQLQTTIASTAMELFRRRYLESKIETSDEINLLARRAYSSSRVEVFRPVCQKANYFDINSSFPFSMTKPHPGNVIRRDKKLSTKPGAIYLAECEIHVPPMYLPPLPYRNQDGRVYFPIGKWRGWMSSVDVELAQTRGCRIEKVHDVVHFDARQDLAAYAIDIYERRLDAKKRGSEFESIVYKYLLNSLYGKFAEQKEKQKLLIRPESTECPHKPKHDDNRCMQVLQPGIYIMTEECDIIHEWVPISVHITALSRALLESHLYACRSRIFYCDTDSIITEHELPTGDKLGELKLEMKIEEGTFVAPKLYRVKGQEIDGLKQTPTDKVKAKGFRKLGVAEFQQLRDGLEVGIETMVRLREMLKRGHQVPMEKVFGKAFRGSTRPKRCVEGNDSRPWTTTEVDQKYVVKKVAKPAVCT